MASSSSPRSGNKIPLRCPKCQKSFGVAPDTPAERTVCPTCKVSLVDLITGYRIDRKLGAGGMGDVFLADQTSLGRPVALKILPLSLTKDPTYVKRFLIEARAAGRMSHENIVAGVDAGEDGGRPYFVMEYVEGETLLDVIKREGPLDEGRVARIARQVALGLKAAFAQGLIHRDIKPANIMITKNGTAKICDFGLARDLTSDIKLTQEGTVHTSPGYASPEQCKGEKNLDARTDMYSLGVSLFEAVTKKLPFDGDSAGALLVKHVTEQPRAPKSVNPNVSSGMNQLILRLMRKQPNGRFSDYDELLGAIENLGKEKSQRVAKKPGTTKIPHARTQSPLPLVLGGAGVVAVLLVVVIVMISGGKEPETPALPQVPATAAKGSSAAERDLARIRDLTGKVQGQPSQIAAFRKEVITLVNRYRSSPAREAFEAAAVAFETEFESAATRVARTFLDGAEGRLSGKKDAAALKELKKYPQGFAGTAAAREVSKKAEAIRKGLETHLEKEIAAIEGEVAKGKASEARSRLAALVGRVTYIGPSGQAYLTPPYKIRLSGLSKRISEEELLARKRDVEKPPPSTPPAPSPKPPAPKPPSAQKPKPAPLPAAAPRLSPKSPPVAAPAMKPAKLPVPSKADQIKAKRAIREIFADDYARESVTFQFLLAKKLYNEAKKSSEEPVARYVLLTESAELAADVGEARAALLAVRELARVFDADEVELRSDVLSTAGRKVYNDSQRVALAEEHLKLAARALEEDDFTAAQKSARAASSIARRTRKKEVGDQASALSKEISAVRRAYASMKTARAALERNPDDARSSLVVGRYECFLRGRWEEGLPHLVKSAHEEFAEAAKKDLARPADRAARLAVGDAWWEAAGRESEPAKTEIRCRAAGWYQSVVDGATGIEAIRIKRRISDIPEGKISTPAIAAGGTPGGSSAPSSPGGLIGHWTFDETSGTVAADSSGNGITARARRPVAWTPGRVGGGVQMTDNRNAFATDKTASTLGLAGAAPRTVAAWVYTRLFDGGGIIDLGDYVSGENFGIKTNETPDSWRAQFWGGRNDINFSIPSQDRWVHLALSYDGTVARVYADGREVAQRAITINTTDTNPLTIGAWKNISFKGTLDDLRLYRRALSATDIAGLMGGGPPPTGGSNAGAPWTSVFDGTSLASVKHNDAWQLSGGALVRISGQKSAVQTRDSWSDVDIRFRFEVKDAVNVYFKVRQGVDGHYTVNLDRPTLRGLEGGPRELVFFCRGSSVTATLDGAPATVTATGAPTSGKIQINAPQGEPGFRLLSIDVRDPK